MENRTRLTMFFFLCLFLLLITVMHLFRIWSFPIDRFSYFLISLVTVVFILPVVGGVRFFGTVQVSPRKGVLGKKL